MSQNNKVSEIDQIISLERELKTLFNDAVTEQLAKYLLYKVSTQYDLKSFTYGDFLANKLDLDDDVRFLIEQKIGKDGWKKLTSMKTKYSNEVLRLCALLSANNDAFNSDSLPESIVKLISKLLSIKDSEKIADLHCGTGNLLSYLKSDTQANDVSYIGIDINNESIVFAKIANDVKDNKIEYQQKNVFDLCLSQNKPIFDKIISISPLGIPVRSLRYTSEYVKRILADSSSSLKITSADWIYNSVICDLLSKNGVGIGLMTSGGTWNSSDKDMRKYFIERGLIKCIISLPPKIFDRTNIATSLVVFSQGNENVTFVDLTNLYVAKTRDECSLYEIDAWGQDCFKDEREKEESGGDSPVFKRCIPDYIIDEIINLMERNSGISRIVSKQEIIENDYNLNPMYYMDNQITFENAVTFGDLIKNITRGISRKSSDIEEITSSAETNYKYLMVSNLSNGLINEDLLSLTNIEEKYKKYCLKSNDLIISKSGFPYKIAVSEITGKKVLVNDNLYIITLDENRANPFYIKAFLDSKKGQYLLKRASVGSIIPNISVEAIKKLQIPLPDISEQDRIAKLFLAAKDEYLINKIRMEKSIDKLFNVFDDNAKD